MWAYYNEFEPAAADWLERLIANGKIPDGIVDRRSIVEVAPDDLEGFAQCHFFAGIGGWPLALRLAGWPDDRPVWTGSAPCQPFSLIGEQKGFDDERHLAPTWLKLIAECRPDCIFGEQVATPAARVWLADLQLEMEALGLAFGAADLSAAGVAAPHIRQRLYFGACRLGHRRDTRLEGYAWYGHNSHESGRLNEDENRPVAPAGTAGDWSGSPDCPWQDADWLGCSDGRWRPVQPGTQPMADGVPDRVALLKGYGNAIVPQLGQEFILSFEESVNELEVSNGT